MRHSYCFRIIATVACLWAVGAEANAAEEKPNVIVVFTDDHGYADLSCQGVFDDVKTPHIDTLATGGVRMANGYVTALYWHWVGQAAIREGKRKYIHGGSRFYLFDLDRDIGEKKNLIDENPEIAKSLAQRLEQWSQTLKPPGLPKAPTAAESAFFDYYLDGKSASHPKYPPKKNADNKPTASARKRPSSASIIEMQDTDNDGRLTLKEYIGVREGRNIPALERQFKAFD